MKTLDGLHAKVFISNAGAVVGSADASRDGLLAKPVSNLEAGTFYTPDSKGWHDARAWFDQLFADAAVADELQLQRAPETARAPGRRIDPDGHRAKSLLNIVRSYPDEFVDTLFVCTRDDLSDDRIRELEEVYSEEVSAGCYSDGSRELIMEDEVANLSPSRPYLVIFLLGQEKALEAYCNVVSSPPNVPEAAFGRLDWNGFLAAHKLPNTDVSAVFKADKARAASIKTGEWVMTAAALSNELLEFEGGS